MAPGEGAEPFPPRRGAPTGPRPAGRGAPAAGRAGETVNVGGHRLRLTNLDKVLYPAAGTTKADVLAYLAAVADVCL